MAQISQIMSVSNKHGETARVTELAIAIEALIKALIKAITPKTITKS